jgi:hypothetical protein
LTGAAAASAAAATAAATAEEGMEAARDRAGTVGVPAS